MASYIGGNGNDFVLTNVSPVPEPSTYVASALVVCALGWQQRRWLRRIVRRA